MSGSPRFESESVERWLDGTASAEERRDLETRAADDDALRERLVARFLETAEPVETRGELPAEPPQVPADVLRQVRGLVPERPAARRPRVPALRFAVPLAAVVLLTAGLAVLGPLGGGAADGADPVLRGAVAESFTGLSPEPGATVAVTDPAVGFTGRLDGEVAAVALRLFDGVGSEVASYRVDAGAVSVDPATLGPGLFYWSFEATLEDGTTLTGERRVLRIVDGSAPRE